jgi:hypothetical protein
MLFGLNVQNFGVFGDPLLLVEMARDAESSGWDGFFLWDHLYLRDGPDRPFADPTATIAAIAATTTRIRIGPMVTSPARNRPWKLAREIVTLDRLSGGRLTLGIGLGWSDDDYAPFGETTSLRERAERTDETLAILDGLQSGERFSFAGKHYAIDDVRFLPTPVQRPRVPVWVAMTWRGPATGAAPGPMRRAARVDGAYPEKPVPHGDPDWDLSAADVTAMLGDIRGAGGGAAGYDMAVSGAVPASNPDHYRTYLADIERAGATWWIVPVVQELAALEELRSMVRAGPWGDRA